VFRRVARDPARNALVLNVPDFLIVGSGLTGATIARTLHEHEYSVLVIERRPHLGGNVFDESHASGIRYHTYGPHYFRTSSERIWAYVNRFADFFRYEASLMSYVGERFEHWPAHKFARNRRHCVLQTPHFRR
jgi:UDP-galactopyranose mutase